MDDPLEHASYFQPYGLDGSEVPSDLERAITRATELLTRSRYGEILLPDPAELEDCLRRIQAQV